MSRLSTHLASLAFVASLLQAAPALADEALKPLAVKPGLWETTVTIDTTGKIPGMEEALAKMSPEQRAQVEAKLLKGPKTLVSKSCITKEEFQKPLDFGGEDDHCRKTLVRSTPSEQEFKVECKAEGATQVSNAHVVAVDPEHVKMTATAVSSKGEDRMNVSTTAEAKWIGTDCKDEDED